LTVFDHGGKTPLELLISTTLIEVDHAPKVVLSLVDITEKNGWKPGFSAPRKWKPSAVWPGGLPMISTILATCGKMGKQREIIC
jgi:hypothetical protein